MSDCVASTGCGPNPQVSKPGKSFNTLSDVAIVNEIITDTLINRIQYNDISTSRSDLNNIKIFPNPISSNILTVESLNGIALNSVAIYDLKGNRVLYEQFDKDEISITKTFYLPNINSGMYIILIKDDNGDNYWNKIIKQ